MSAAQQVIQKAIKEKKAIRLFLLTNDSMEGGAPVHLTFVGNSFRIKETSHHKDEKDELELIVDYGRIARKVAWTADDPKNKVKVQLFEDADLWMHHFNIYAFVELIPVIPWDDPRVLGEGKPAKPIQSGKLPHIMSEW